MTREEMEENLQKLKSRKARMIEYLKLKVEEEDWHGSADASMDLRDIENQMIVYSLVLTS